MVMDPSFLPFFQPSGVVVIGVSTSAGKLGYGVARNLTASGYPGAIHFVGQREGILFDKPIYTELTQVPDPVDLAVLILPPPATPDAIRSCAARGIKAVIIVSSGFREAGPEGAALEQECLAIARAGGVRLLGPNCIGVLNTGLPLDTTFLQSPLPSAGDIGFISHSGAFCAAIIDWSQREGFGYSQVVSLGNQADLNETDLLPAIAEDEHTRAIALYLEGVSDGRRFVSVARRVSRQKPVVALKAGRSKAGQRAAASHTGAMASSETAFEAAFEKAGVLRAESAEQLFDWARALADCPLPRGRGVAILTDAGGPGVIAADALERNGLGLPALSGMTNEALSGLLPPAASVRNPVDMLASASPEDYGKCLKILLADPNVDGALVILPPPPMFKAEAVAEALVDSIRSSDKPVVIALLGSTLVEQASLVFQQAHIPAYPFPERAASALGALARRADDLEARSGAGFDDAWQTLPSPSDKPVSAGSAEDLLRSYGIETAPVRLAISADEAAALSEAVGFPLAMKIASPDLAHKSDVGGVILGIETAKRCRRTYTQLIDHVRAARPEARIEGVLLQRQVPPGQEVILGMVRDPQFGPLMMFGSGGVEVEGLKDAAFCLAPLSPAEAEGLIAKTWAGRKLRGYRSIPPVDQQAVVDALVQLSQLVSDHPEIVEVEINPLRVLSKGAVAVDVRMR
jgi:acetyltransferase